MTKKTTEKKSAKKTITKKKIAKKEEKGKVSPKVSKPKEKYFYAVGRRKTSVAQVRIYPEEKVTESDWIVNGKKMKQYFPSIAFQDIFIKPLRISGLQDKFRVSVLVKGGGVRGQTEATQLGIARALVKSDEKLKKVLKAEGLLTRDARKVERKKPGLKKARRAPQWAKR